MSKHNKVRAASVTPGLRRLQTWFANLAAADAAGISGAIGGGCGAIAGWLGRWGSDRLGGATAIGSLGALTCAGLGLVVWVVCRSVSSGSALSSGDSGDQVKTTSPSAYSEELSSSAGIRNAHESGVQDVVQVTANQAHAALRELISQAGDEPASLGTAPALLAELRLLIDPGLFAASFRIEQVPLLMALANEAPWAARTGGERARLSALLGAAFELIDDGPDRAELRILMPLDPHARPDSPSKRRRRVGELRKRGYDRKTIQRDEPRMLVVFAEALADTVRERAEASDPSTEPAPSFTRRLDDLLPPSLVSAALREEELAVTGATNAGPWWAPGSAGCRWLEHLWVVWLKTGGLPASELPIVLEPGGLTAATFDWTVKNSLENTPGRAKVALRALRGFTTSDMSHELRVVTVDYPLVRDIEERRAEFQTNCASYPFFSENGIPFPGILVLHAICETVDGWVLLNRRRRKSIDEGSDEGTYMPGVWSASFEEMLDVGHGTTAKPKRPDATIHDTLVRGLWEEFGVPFAALVGKHVIPKFDGVCMAVGREAVVPPGQGRTILNSGVIVAATLPLTKADVFERISDIPNVEDLDEHEAWIAAKFRNVAQVDAVVSRDEQHMTLSTWERHGIEIDVHPLSDHADDLRSDPILWHPTSRTRLVLWSEWASDHTATIRSPR